MRLNCFAIAALLGCAGAFPPTIRSKAKALTAAVDQSFSLYAIGAAVNFSEISYNQLTYANGSAYIGMVKYAQYSEPLVMNGVDTLYFTSIHQAPSGIQFMYIDPGAMHVAFTQPYQDRPAANVLSGFNATTDGDLSYNGTQKWFACETADAGTRRIQYGECAGGWSVSLSQFYTCV